MSLALTPVVVFGTVLFGFVVLALRAWAHFDARARGSGHPTLWGVFAPLSGIVLTYYLL